MYYKYCLSTQANHHFVLSPLSATFAQNTVDVTVYSEWQAVTHQIIQLETFTRCQ